MAAISAIVLATATPDKKIVASDRLYGRTVQLFRQELPRYGVETEFVDACDFGQVKKALAGGASMLFVETTSNPMLRVVDLVALVDLTRRADALLVVDNTFASPALVKPLELGADLVMESLTKMLAGHSDVTLGLVAGNEPDLFARVQAASTIWGFSANPFDCWLAERGLETFDLRDAGRLRQRNVPRRVVGRATGHPGSRLSGTARPSRSRACPRALRRPIRHDALLRAGRRPGRGRPSS